MGKKKGKGKSQEGASSSASVPPQQQPVPPQQQPVPPQQQPVPPQQQLAQGDSLPQESQQVTTKKKGGKAKKPDQAGHSEQQQPAQHEPPPQESTRKGQDQQGKQAGPSEQQTRQGKGKSQETQPLPQQPAQEDQPPRQEPQQGQLGTTKKKGGKAKKPDQAGHSEQQMTPPPKQGQDLPQTGAQKMPAWGRTQAQSVQPPQAQGAQPQYSPQHQPPQAQWGQPPQVQRGQPQYQPQQQVPMGPPRFPPQSQPPQAHWEQVQRGQPPFPHQQQARMGPPQFPPQQQAQMGPPQFPPQQQAQMGPPPHQPQMGPSHQQPPLGRPQQGQPPQPGQTQYQQQPQTSHQQSQGGRGRGRPQQVQSPQPGLPPQLGQPSTPGQPPQPAQPQQQLQQQPKKSQPSQQPQGAKGKGKSQQQGPSQSTQQTRVSPPTQQMSLLQVGDLPPIEYHKFQPGTKGRKILVETNHLQLTLGKLRSAIHYDVNLVPDTPKKYLRLVVELFRQRHFPKRFPAFDGRKNLYSTTRLPFDDFISDEIVYQEADGRDRTYKVEIKFANEVDLSPLHNFDLSRETPREALQVVDIVLRSAPAVNLISVGRSFFAKPPVILDLGEGMEMYNGFYQSAIRGWKPFLNVDVAHKSFPKNINVTDALVELFDSYYQSFRREDLNRPLDGRQRETFEKYIKTLRVTYEIPGIPSSKRSYRVNGIGQAPKDKVFTLDSGRSLTIENYFATEKKYRLKYPHLPSLWVGDRNRPNPILLPLELCIIEQNQVLNRKMTENQTSKMIKYAATNTEVRKQKIKTALQQANHNQNHTIREFGFSIANEFEKLEARILQPPSLVYYNQVQDRPSKGIWRGNKFFIGVEINKWTIACADRRPPRPDDLARLADMIYRTSGGCGMHIKEQAEKPFITMGFNLNDIKKFFHTQKEKNYDVIFVIVPNSGQQYSFVKTAAEINSGCLTQCIKMRTLGKLNPQTVTNILLKVNAKLNGTNHCLLERPPIMNRPCMIMGADVTHPSPDSQGIPSVAAVTASHDPKAFKYNICWRLQPPKVEIIEDLEAITLEQLKYFYEKNKIKPERIVFFRDGVSEGQFDQVRLEEIRAIRSACKKIQATGYEPKITFLVVQKRHHTRLFPTNPRDSEDRNMNVPAGTCVDSSITHPFMQDFYLVSHASIQGVAKPTKYCTLWDDNEMSNDEIEALTYHLCHMFTRCNRSVSYPAPTYYAHLAAARAKVYIENDRIDLENLQREFAKYPIQDVIRKGKPMFFV